MSGPATEPDELSPLARLVAECVRRLEERGPSGVDELCAQHPELAPELRRRLAALEETGLVGSGRVGPYVLLRPLGRGGMGVVHLARDTRDGRVVALKALPGRLLQSEAARERFRREAQAVQALRHPGIVPLFEAGESDGVPWFTMEWIDGRTLADVIAALSAMELAAERLDSSHLAAATGATPEGDGRGRAWVDTVCRLALDVAEALHYAHGQGVIHRDVKPGNILVGRDGQARLFDFGLARLDDATRMTLSGDFAGTPAYAAPEQARGSTLPLDGRADVYALGVTLYELLTLVLPPDATSPRAPVAPRRLNATVGRDVETICLAAIERDRERRYPTAAAFAADLRAALEHRPIAARGPRWPRRVARWAARHRGAALAVALAVVLAVGTPVGLAVANARIREQAERALAQQQLAEDASRAADEQRARAQADAQRARLRLEFLREMLASPSPLISGPDVKVRDVLDRAAEAAPDDLASDPLALADTLTTLGLSYFRVADYPAGEEQFRTAIALCRGHEGGELDDTLALALGGLMGLLTETGRIDEARVAGEEALAISRRRHGERSTQAAEQTASLGIVAIRSGDDARAVELLREALALQTELLGARDLATIGTQLNLAGALQSLDDPLRDEAEALMRSGIEALRPRVAAGREGQRLAAALRNLALLVWHTDRLPEAIELERESLELTLQWCGEAHPDATTSRTLLAMMLETKGDYAEATGLVRTVIATLRQQSPASDGQLAKALVRLGTLQAGQGQMAEAESTLQEALDLSRRLGGPLDPTAIDAAGVLAAVLVELGRRPEARAMLEDLSARALEAGPAGAKVAFRCKQALDQLAAEEAAEPQR
ncbi:MAG TPA: serine/threonine-protein kinase [Planctomycetota bacterium]|nr:serine/threonine-protein kinase [Planctomycetota bacterium]